MAVRAVDALLECYPRIAFFFPTIRPYGLTAEGSTMQVREHVAGLLWMVGLLHDERGMCPLLDLRRVFMRWWPSTAAKTNFAHYLRELIDEKLLTETVAERDRRRRTVRLTKRGTEVLRAIRESRRNAVAEATQHLGAELTSQLVALANQVAPILWRAARSPLRRAK